MVKLMLFGILSIVSFGHLTAQIISVVRTELTYDRDFQPLGIYGCGEKGIIVSASLDPKKAERDPDRLYIMYDTSLIETHSIEVEVPFRHKLITTHQSGNKLYTLYYDARFGKATIIVLDPMDSFPTRHEIKVPKRLLIDDFIASESAAILAVKRSKKDDLFKVNFKTGQTTQLELPGNLKRKSIELLDLNAFEDGSGFGVVIREFNRSSNNTFLMVLDETGFKEHVLPLKSNDLTVVQANVRRLQDGQFVVSGTYSDNSLMSSKGMFMAVYDDVVMRHFVTRSFGTFDNFFDYMSSHGQKAMERRKERYEERGKKLDITVNMNIHPVVQSGERLILLGEVYYPTYRTLATANTFIQGRPTSNSVRQFDGYQYTHAAACIFDLDGHFIGDYCFPIRVWHKPYELKDIVNVYAYDSTLELMYMNDNYLQNKTITPSEEFAETVVLKADSTDQIRYTVGEVKHWFSNYLIASGYQNIKNTGDVRIRRKRDVFYLEKLEVLQQK